MFEEENVMDSFCNKTWIQIGWKLFKCILFRIHRRKMKKIGVNFHKIGYFKGAFSLWLKVRGACGFLRQKFCDRLTDTQTGGYTDGHTDGHTDRRTDRQMGRWTDRQTDKWTEGQTGWRTEPTLKCNIWKVLHYRVFSGFTHKYQTRQEMLVRDKYSNLLRTFLNYGRKPFYNFRPWAQCYKLFMAVIYELS